MSIEDFNKTDEVRKQAVLSAALSEFAEKSFREASTEAIAVGAGISKGLLFYYFGTKRELYLYSLDIALSRLTEPTNAVAGDFYELLFGVLDSKLRLCAAYPKETKFVNMASREPSGELSGRAELFAKYAAPIRAASANYLASALALLPLKEDAHLAAQGFGLYVNAIIAAILARYQQTPKQFFAETENIKAEIKALLDLLLYGIVKEK